MSEFHFLRPLWLLALPAVAALVVWLLRAGHSSRSWAAVCDAALLPFVLVAHGGPQRRSAGPWLTGAAGTLLVLALAGPAWERLPQPVFRDQSALVIALDLSRSMDAADLKPSRLTRASHKITDILNSRQGGQSALLVYAGEAFTVTPLSDDADTILAQLNSLDTGMMPSQGSRADLAVETAGALLRQAGAAHGHVLLVTDGIQGESLAAPLEALRRQGHRLSILAPGTRDGAPIPMADGGFLKDAQGSIVIPKLDTGSLQQWAQRGGGRYAQVRADDRDIRYLFDEHGSRSLDQAQRAADLQTDRWREQGPWLILLAVPLAALAFRRGVLVLLLGLLIPLPGPVHALDWTGLWHRPDQQGMRALRQGDTEQAAQMFEDPHWKAAAQYRAGQYQQAANSLESIETPDALYNRGNALAKLGRYPEAMASYQRALELDPEHADARHNLELLQQQQQESQSSQDGDESSDRQDDAQQASGEEDTQAGDQQPADSGAQASPSEQASGEETADRQNERQASGSGEETPAEQPQHESGSPTPSQPQPESSEPQDQTDAVDTAALNERSGDPPSDSASEQWLRRIPDDPGGLLRRKFLYQYQQRERRAKPEDQPW